MVTTAFIGQIVHTKSLNDFEAIPNGFIAVAEGKIIAVGTDYATWKESNPEVIKEVELQPSQFLMPGLIDCHIHAPQMPNIGLGLDKPLMEWLESYTFPTESRYVDEHFAKHVYEKVVRTTIKHGTTLAAYFATNHKESSILLAKEAIKQGQRAFVGKTSSDCNCPSYYVETFEESISETESFVKSVLDLNNDLVKPIITPRFAISCTTDLMKALASLANEYNLNVQSHVSENISEIEFVKQIYGKMYVQVYEDNGLLTNKCILAHGVHLEDEELVILKHRETSIAHCPASNTQLASGLCDVKRILEAGVKVGLGTDVSGGSSASILHAMVRCLDVSQHLNAFKKQSIKGTGQLTENLKNILYEPLNYKQVLFLATLGGAEALSLEEKVGNFTPGKSFDALLIETDAFPIDNFHTEFYCRPPIDRLLELVQKFVYVGDDRNILKVFIEGQQVK